MVTASYAIRYKEITPPPTASGEGSIEYPTNDENWLKLFNELHSLVEDGMRIEKESMNNLEERKRLRLEADRQGHVVRTVSCRCHLTLSCSAYMIGKEVCSG